MPRGNLRIQQLQPKGSEPYFDFIFFAKTIGQQNIDDDLHDIIYNIEKTKNAGESGRTIHNEKKKEHNKNADSRKKNKNRLDSRQRTSRGGARASGRA